MDKNYHALYSTDRYFYSSHTKRSIDECKASKPVVATWYKEFKMFDKIKPGKTYAQALLSHAKNNSIESTEKKCHKNH